MSRAHYHGLATRKQLGALVACLLCSVIVVSCGSSANRTSPVTSEPSRSTGSARNIVTPSEVARAGGSTVRGVVLRWFQAVQYRDFPTVLELTTSHVLKATTQAVLSDAVNTVGSALGRPAITGTVAHGPNEMSVHVVVLGFAPAAVKPANEVPITLTVSHSAAGWQVDDVRYLLESAKAIVAASRRAP